MLLTTKYYPISLNPYPTPGIIDVFPYYINRRINIYGIRIRLLVISDAVNMATRAVRSEMYIVNLRLRYLSVKIY